MILGVMLLSQGMPFSLLKRQALPLPFLELQDQDAPHHRSSRLRRPNPGILTQNAMIGASIPLEMHTSSPQKSRHFLSSAAPSQPKFLTCRPCTPQNRKSKLASCHAGVHPGKNPAVPHPPLLLPTPGELFSVLVHGSKTQGAGGNVFVQQRAVVILEVGTPECARQVNPAVG